MIMKLLLTLGVIVAAWLVLHHRHRRRRLSAAAPPPQRLASPSRRGFGQTPRLAAYALVVCMILASGVILYLQWRDDYRVVSVRVINTQTGQTVSYEARRGDVESRQFQTLDGRWVQVADIERIEMGQLMPSQLDGRR